MMAFLSRWMLAWFGRIQRKEMESFVDRISSMDGSELGYLVAIATHQRHHWEDEGYNFLDPIVSYSMDPTVVLKIGRVIREYQKVGQPSDAAALMVWLHTMRVGGPHELRHIARQMWRQLSRGFPHVPKASVEIARLIGDIPRIDGYDSFPIGLTPDPL
ncbi:hypothetical protein IPC1147_16725 [Pseudomonas aeruginosa]|nr:hypothetical protein B7D75_05695 [Pseudomonas paraeruginosa]KSM36223.1 hypothetical protein APA63_30400 [Pseudomonas aeruginosa]RPM70214.1 hypothetical protein IPC1289_09670 [Pseudomonas aeruginosa]RPR42020.1 hypothetical protein IPC1057_10215 [Pseudomonas aeruginosa]RRS25909.1 hypothetical protein IPC1147_16725 [Pseudomonas aeruginosa]